jgi:hypothetical protein
MKNKTLSAFIILLIITGLYFLGRYLMEPKFGTDQENPYDLKLDSIGKIETEKFGNYLVSSIQLAFNETKAIAVHKDNLYVSGDSKLAVLNNKGDIINEFDTKRTVTSIHLTDKMIIAGIQDHILLMDLEGNIIKAFETLGDKAYITSVTQLNDKIYAAEAESELVYEYSIDGTISDILGDSVPANDIMRFVLPSYYFDLDVGPDGFLWISNTGKHKIMSINPDGTMRSNWGTSSSALEDFCGCCNPSHFRITEDGSFITSEKGIVRIKKYDAAGNFVHAIAGPDQFQKGSEGLDIAVDENGTIYVLEPAANTIHIFTEKDI